LIATPTAHNPRIITVTAITIRPSVLLVLAVLTVVDIRTPSLIMHYETNNKLKESNLTYLNTREFPC